MSWQLMLIESLGAMVGGAAGAFSAVVMYMRKVATDVSRHEIAMHVKPSSLYPDSRNLLQVKNEK